MEGIITDSSFAPPDVDDMDYDLDINNVTVKGRIAHIYKSNGFVNATIFAGITGRRGAENHNYPDVIFFGDLAEQAAKELNEGDFVTIQAHMRSRRRDPRSTVQAKHFKWQEVCADSFSKAESIMDESMPGCEIRLTGIVMDYKSPSDNIVSIYIGVKMPNNISYRILGTYYTRNAAKTVEDLHVGDKISCIATIESRKTASGYHENMVIRNFNTESKL